MIHFQNVRKAYLDQTVLHDVSFEILAGENVALLGASGAGKSTILRLCLGLEEPDAGSVQIGDDAESSDSLVRRRAIGFVPQQGILFPHLTAQENIVLGVQAAGWHPEIISKRLHEIQQISYIRSEVLSKFPHELSGGQVQRVAIARALIHDPKIILLDEPTSSLDPLLRYDMRQELQDIFASFQKTLVLVTHDMAEVEILAKKVYLLEQGLIVQQGSLQELRENPSPTLAKFFAMGGL